MSEWIIGEIHPIYGEIQMMGILSGERYRWAVKDNVVSMMPLEMLQSTTEKVKEANND